MSKMHMRILGTGSFLPKNLVSNLQLEKNLGLNEGWIEKRTGMKSRYHVSEEFAVDLAVGAARIAVQEAGIKIEEIDLVIGVSGIMQQAIPSMSALIHRRLGLKQTQTFDVNATCLSFLTGMSIAAQFIEKKSYRNILLVSADVASPGLNPQDPKTATLFGDGAAAVVVGPSGDSSSHVKACKFETWSEDQDCCLFEAGGSKLHLKKLPKGHEYRQYFQMDGPKLFKAAVPHSLKMLDVLLEKAGLDFQDLNFFIPHQASPYALKVFYRQLIKYFGNFSCHYLNIVQSFGNMVATSLPHALDYAIKNKLLKRGDRCLLFGTSAGLSVGGVALEY